jgi:hypothetical protein
MWRWSGWRFLVKVSSIQHTSDIAPIRLLSLRVDLTDVLQALHVDLIPILLAASVDQ